MVGRAGAWSRRTFAGQSCTASLALERNVDSRLRMPAEVAMLPSLYVRLSAEQRERGEFSE